MCWSEPPLSRVSLLDLDYDLCAHRSPLPTICANHRLPQVQGPSLCCHTPGTTHAPCCRSPQTHSSASEHSARRRLCGQAQTHAPIAPYPHAARIEIPAPKALALARPVRRTLDLPSVHQGSRIHGPPARCCRAFALPWVNEWRVSGARAVHNRASPRRKGPVRRHPWYTGSQRCG
jgi:hypothetical protein